MNAGILPFWKKKMPTNLKKKDRVQCYVEHNIKGNPSSREMAKMPRSSFKSWQKLVKSSKWQATHQRTSVWTWIKFQFFFFEGWIKFQIHLQIKFSRMTSQPTNGIQMSSRLSSPSNLMRIVFGLSFKYFFRFSLIKRHFPRPDYKPPSYFLLNFNLRFNYQNISYIVILEFERSFQWYF